MSARPDSDTSTGSGASAAFLTSLNGVANEGADGRNWTYTVNLTSPSASESEGFETGDFSAADTLFAYIVLAGYTIGLLASTATVSVVLPLRMAAFWDALPSPLGALLWIPFATSVAIGHVRSSRTMIVPVPNPRP